MAKNDDKRIFAFLGVFLTIIGFVIAILAKKDDKYVMYYSKQGLVLFIVSMVVGLAGIILLIIPILGVAVYWVLYVLLLVTWLVGWINALSGKKKPLIILGDLGEKFKI